MSYEASMEKGSNILIMMNKIHIVIKKQLITTYLTTDQT
jgi:hypothetical protein